MKKTDIEVGTTYLFVGSDSPKRKHLAGLPFTVVSVDRVYRKVAYRKGKRSMKVTRFFNAEGIGAKAEELETLPNQGFHTCPACKEVNRICDLHVRPVNEEIEKACPNCGETAHVTTEYVPDPF
jgi:hypothetical protein